MTTGPAPTSSHTRYETLDGMRGIAALIVMVYHYSEHTHPRLFYNAYLAVDLFFILSGFVIVHSYGKRLQKGMSFLEYIGKRFVRLYPMFFIGLVIGAPLYYLLQKSDTANSPPSFIATSFLANLFYLPALNGFGTYNFGSPTLVIGEVFPTNPPAWSLFFEVIASAAFLILYRLSRNNLIKVVACSYAAYLLCGFLYSMSLPDHRHALDLTLGWSGNTLYGGFPRVIFCFTYGILIYSFATDPHFDTYRKFIETWVKRPSILYVLLILVFLVPAGVKGLYPALILALVAPSLVYIGSIVRCPDNASLKVAQFLGWISYPLYCLHFPIGRAIFLLTDHAHYSRNLAIVASIATSLAASVVLTKFYDEPARAYFSKKLSQWLAADRTHQTGALSNYASIPPKVSE